MGFVPQHIVAAVDLTRGADDGMAREVVEAAADLAKRFSAKLTLLHVEVPAGPVVPVAIDAAGIAIDAMSAMVDERNARAEQRLDELCQAARAQGADATASTVELIDTVPAAIVAGTKRVGGDFIVLSSHGRKGVARLVLGSVAEVTVRQAKMPVLVLPAH